MTEEEMTKEEKPEEKKEEQAVPSLKDVLAKYDGSPQESEIQDWKVQFGEIYCSAFSDTEIFIWRPLGRAEWTQNQLALSQAETQVDPFQIEEEVVRSCLLWTSELGQRALKLKAGSISTLHEQLLQNSNFVDPRVASNLVVKL